MSCGECTISGTGPCIFGCRQFDPAIFDVIRSLSDSYTPEGVRIWLNSPNRNLGGDKPIDLIRRGEEDRALEEADRLAGGPVVIHRLERPSSLRGGPIPPRPEDGSQ
ncbi:MAG: hypothetical protein JWO67_2234 [Streptosporangiaceae bacterium]|nr:hypothetical protein [Streptosporangiaceae bacterium]